MRIALDARTVYRPHRRGTGKNLIDLYRQVAAMRPEWEVLAYHRQEQPDLPGINAPFMHERRVEMAGDRFDAWGRLRLPLCAWQDGADLLHCPANHCPSWLPLPTVVTIHDLIPLDLPGEVPAGEAARFESSVKLACRRAAWIVTPSLYTAQRLVSEFGADAQRITVNPWAADASTRKLPPEDYLPALDRLGIAQPFVLHFGAGQGRKNTRRLLEAWAMLEAPLRRRWQLVVVGLDEPGQSRLEELARKLNVNATVLLRGFAEEADLPALLSAAGVLAYPSLSEGFGLPVLDAWATDTPVLSSNNSSIPEVAGDAAVLVDPTDSCGIARGLGRLLADAALRRDLIDRGRLRRTEYTWERTAWRFVETLERVRTECSPLRIAA